MSSSDQHVRLEDLSAQIRVRLQEIIDGSSQASVARKTGTPQASVSRYLRDRKIPAEFCARLATQVGVNPLWLLTGEGGPYLADISPEARQSGAKLLELLQGMESASTLQLNALLGRHDRRDLVELDRCIDRIDALRAAVREQVVPVFAQIEEACTLCVTEGKEAEAEAHLLALARLLRLCPDRDLLDSFDEISSDVHFLRGQFDEQLERIRSLFLRGLSDPRTARAEDLRRHNKYVWTLYQNFHLAEAQKIAEVLEALYRDHRADEWYARLALGVGIMQMELGDLERGVERMRRAFDLSRERDFRTFTRPWVLLGFVLRGDFDLQEAVGAERERLRSRSHFERSVAARMLARQALALECPLALAAVEEELGEDLAWSDEHRGECIGASVAAVRQSLEGGDPTRLATFLEHPGVRASREAEIVKRVEVEIRTRQIARLCGVEEVAAAARAAVLAHFNGMSSEQTPWLVLRWAHHANVLRASDSDDGERAAADAFLRFHRERGYRGFEPPRAELCPAPTRSP